MISTVGPWQLRGQPSLNRVYSEEGLDLYLIDVGDGELQFHAQIEGEISLSRMKHFDKVFWTLIALLDEKGLDHLITWIEYDNEKQKRMAEFFGFEMTGFIKSLELENGSEKFMEEMVLIFPTKEQDE